MKLLDALFAETPELLLRELLRHPLAPRELSLWLAQKPGEPPVAQTSKAPRQAMTQRESLRLLQSRELLSHQLEEVMYQDDPLVRRALARHKDAPLIFLLSVVFGGELGEQLALSKNPSLPEPIRRWIEEHPRLRQRGEATSQRHRRGSLS